MSIIRILKISCDHCGNFTTFHEDNESKAKSALKKRDWIFESIGPRGDELVYCNESCRDLGLEELQEPKSEQQ